MAQLLDLFLHLDTHLSALSSSLGPWMYVLLFAILFCETGLIVMPFLPGDSLLFAVGALAALPNSGLSLGLLMVLLVTAAVLGDAVNYAVGRKLGPTVFRSESSFLLNKKHLLHTQNFYEKHGGKTIVLARFMPIIRTFAPVVSGVGRMDYRSFLAFNVVWGIGWVCSMVLTGYFLPALLNPPMRQLLGDESFRVENHIEKVIIVVVLLSIAPGGVAWLRSRLKKSAAPQPVLETIGADGGGR